MKPFQAETAFLKLFCQYPDATALREAIESSSKRSRESVVRLWLTEGIPFAFRDCPALYEAMREWLGEKLSVCPKEITLLGSARIGYSLASPPHYGRVFNPKSDLDLSVVSLSLFEKFSQSFDQWKADYTARIVEPRNAKEHGFWDENMHLVPKTLFKGFVDANKIPTFDRYPIAQSLGQSMWQLKQKLERTEGAPKVRKASIRVYNSWRALVARVSLNLHTALSKHRA